MAWMYFMVALYVAAGINHFLHPGMYLKIMPPYLPYPVSLVYLSGIAEILFSLMLLPAVTRNLGAWLLIALLVALFPANIQMSIDYRKKKRRGFWLTVLRLPLQAVLIWWAWQYTK